jgi:ZIP family zinc transporter
MYSSNCITAIVAKNTHILLRGVIIDKFSSMSFSQAVLLGAISGLTIYIGMPIAKLHIPRKGHIVFLNALAIGILFFLFVDIITHALSPIEQTIQNHTLSAFFLLVALIIGFGSGLLSLVYYGRIFLRKGEGLSHNHLALLIATGIGLHNFSEGLAIGNSAHKGDIKFALLLIIGFGLHNITEAFGIVGPLANKKASWGFLALLALIGGGPNMIGTLVGYWFTADLVSVFFLAAAGGAIMYVIGELLAAGRKHGSHAWNGWGLTIGFFLGIITDLFLVALGV